MIKASIITIGDELLIGQVVDTNSAWIARQLNTMGISVVRRIAVGDVKADIIAALDEAGSIAEVILITGGLGPTADDITKPLLCEYFNGRLEIHEPSLKHVTYLFESVFKRPLTERNIKQAELPDTCTPIPNPRGTAPGMWFEKNEKIYVSMPGVPYEMQGMMDSHVIPALKKQFPTGALLHRTLITFGIGESMLADKIQDFENSLPTHIKLAYLPNFGMVRLRLTGKASDENQLQNELASYFEALKILVADHLIHDEDEPMERIVAHLLIQKQKTLATAESCTGGNIAHLLTSIPGSSAYFQGAVVAYSNTVKSNILEVSSEILEKHGAVSEETVTSMAKGVLKLMKTDYAIAVSGIMGPDGGTDEKPIGTVWVAVGSEKEIKCKRFQFRFDRQKNIQITTVNALNLLRELLINEVMN